MNVARAVMMCSKWRMSIAALREGNERLNALLAQTQSALSEHQGRWRHRRSATSAGDPAQFRVVVTRRPKYACRACEDGVVQAEAPARLIEGGLPTEATVAQVLVSKYADHLPLYRQAQI
ncbi:hypothetical protein ABIB00_007218 [Bradyrhizobium sp. LB14.3]